MTLDQAKQALNDGQTIRHQTWTHTEYIFRAYGQLRDENHVPLNDYEFWRYKHGSTFQSGWEIK